MERYIILVIVTVMMVLFYSMCVVSKQSDERAARMHRKWSEEHKHDDDRTDGRDDIS